MNQFADKDVAAAVGYMKKLTGEMNGTALVPREQIDQLAEINSEPDPVSRADKTLALSQQILQEAQTHLARQKDDLRAIGFDPDHGFDEEQLSSEARNAYDQANDDFQRELDDEIETEVARAMAQAVPVSRDMPRAEHAWA